MDCIFCAIINGDIPSTKVYEDDKCLAFRDINPQAPVHIIVIPKKHIESLNDVNAENIDFVSHIFEVVPVIAKQENIADDGYRLISNCGENAGQTVKHLHFHILAGKTLGEKIV